MTEEALIQKIEDANAALQISNLEEAERLVNQVRKQIEHTEGSIQFSPLVHSKTNQAIATIHLMHGKYDEALDFAQASLNITEEHGLQMEMAKTFSLFSKLNYYIGLYDKSLEFSSKALAVYEEMGDKTSAAYVIGNIGTIHFSLGSYDKALEYMSASLAIEEENKNDSGIARLLANIGLAYMELGSNDMALEYTTKALALHDKLGEKSGVAATTGNLGLIYHGLKSYDQSIEYMSKALSINEEIGNASEVALYRMNIGIVYFELCVFDFALENLQKALILYKELGEKAGIANVLGNLGILFASKKYDGFDFKEAENLLLKAIEQSNELGIQSHLVEWYKALSDLYEIENNEIEALAYFKKYHDVEKEVQSEEANRRAQQIENRRKIEEAERDRQVKLARFQEQEKILLNILPAQIAERILEGEKQIADLHEHVSVFFSDIVGFTQLSQKVTPDELLSMLNEIFSEFDRIARKHGLEKIKTIGDAYMAVAGVPIDCEDHAERAAAFAVDVIEYMKVYRQTNKSELQIRVGLHTGRAIAGVIGENKFAYDLWGDSVNTASRMESHGEAGKIHVSEDFKDALSESSYNFIERGEMEVKGKGKMKTYFLNK